MNYKDSMEGLKNVSLILEANRNNFTDEQYEELKRKIKDSQYEIMFKAISEFTKQND